MARAVQRNAARRFRKAVEATYGELARMPEMGTPGKVRQGKHAGVRLWPVAGFTNYLIAYRPHNVGIAVERLIHAKQDYSSRGETAVSGTGRLPD